MADTSVSFLESLAAQPDDDGWRRFVELYTPLIRGWLRHLAVKEQDTEDLAQEVLTVVVRELPNFKHNEQRGAFRNWLRTVTVNKLRAIWRTGKYQATASGDSDVARTLEQLADPASSLSRLWDQQHDQHIARRLMELLRPTFEPITWQAFRRVALEGAKAATVAAELGISVNAVMLAKSRVLNKLRQESRGLTD